MLKFSVIIPHFDQSISDDSLIRCLGSLEKQTFREFEIILLHDGPQSRQFPDLSGYSNVALAEATEKRYGDFGHSLRDLGIKSARGEYVVHMNADNVLYPDALERLSKGTRDILVARIKMMGLETNPERTMIYYSDPRDYSKYIVLRGIPVRYGNIDCMQFVMKREIWNEHGWYDKREDSDGRMYPKFAKKYSLQEIPVIMGEHW